MEELVHCLSEPLVTAEMPPSLGTTAVHVAGAAGALVILAAWALGQAVDGMHFVEAVVQTGVYGLVLWETLAPPAHCSWTPADVTPADGPEAGAGLGYLTPDPRRGPWLMAVVVIVALVALVRVKPVGGALVEPPAACADLGCDDHDPCTEDTCVAGTGCVHDPVSGLASATCVCLRAPSAACDEQRLPSSVARLARFACALLGRAAEIEDATAQRTLLSQAARSFGAAAAVMARHAAQLTNACRATEAALLLDARSRAEEVSLP